MLIEGINIRERKVTATNFCATQTNSTRVLDVMGGIEDAANESPARAREMPMTLKFSTLENG